LPHVVRQRSWRTTGCAAAGERGVHGRLAAVGEHRYEDDDDQHDQHTGRDVPGSVATATAGGRCRGSRRGRGAAASAEAGARVQGSAAGAATRSGQGYAALGTELAAALAAAGRT